MVPMFPDTCHTFFEEITQINWRATDENDHYCDDYDYEGAKGDWDFRISDLVKIPDGTDI